VRAGLGQWGLVERASHLEQLSLSKVCEAVAGPGLRA
jgi:hypothetical protein